MDKHFGTMPIDHHRARIIIVVYFTLLTLVAGCANAPSQKSAGSTATEPASASTRSAATPVLPSPTVVPTGTPQPIPQAAGPQLGFHIAGGDAEHMRAAKAAGAHFVVKVFSWANIEPEPGYIYWEIPDATLRAADFYGLEVIARLDRPPEWALDPDGSSPTPWKLDAYTAFVQHVLARYGERLAGVIIWNEPNLALEWNDQRPDARAYAEMLKAVYPAAKETAPSVPVLAAGLAFTEGEGDTAINDLDYLRSLYAAGAGNDFDVLAAHAYGFGRPPTQKPETYHLNFRRLELYHNIMDANAHGDVPIWVTEMGWRTEQRADVDAWQIVSPAQQRDYLRRALTYAEENYAWVERMALWELNGNDDDYGFALWHGSNERSLAYDYLVETCRQRATVCSPAAAANRPAHSNPIEILAGDATIRLGDVDTLHPHWVHLYRGGAFFSPEWRGEFYLTNADAERRYDILLETLQVDQPTNRILINGTELTYLHLRTRLDWTSTWVTQRFSLPADLLQPGVNTIRITAGPRNPAQQFRGWRWENFQFRNIRLVLPPERPAPLFAEWQTLPSPSGWAETNRLRPGLNDDDFWVTGNRAGQLWRGELHGDGVASLANAAGSRTDLIYVDVLPTEDGTLAATASGLFWKPDDGTWTQTDGSPAAYAYVVYAADGRLYAGFQDHGLWSAELSTGEWRQIAFANSTVLDLLATQTDAGTRFYAATAEGIFTSTMPTQRWQQMPAVPGDADFTFTRRLFPTDAGGVVVRSRDHLWHWTGSTGGEWQLFGPPVLLGMPTKQEHLSVIDCCDAGTLVGATKGIWRLQPDGEWERLEITMSRENNPTAMLRVDDTIIVAGSVGVYQSTDGREWRKTDGLPSTITDLIVDPNAPNRWIAATPAGAYRSIDSGQTWERISPPWLIYDADFSAGGRFFLARRGGVDWTDDLGAESVSWTLAEGMPDPIFFSINPHPTDANRIWAGSWGYNVGASDDGGRTMKPIHNGLETLSALDILWHPEPGQVTIATIEGLYRTDDGGQSWFKLPGPLVHQTIHTLHQTADGAIWAGAGDGLWVSRDYGTTWERPDSVPISTVLRIGTLETPEGETWLWAGTERDGLWLSRDGGDTWEFGGLSDHSVYALFFDPLDDSRLVAGTEAGIVVATP